MIARLGWVAAGLVSAIAEAQTPLAQPLAERSVAAGATLFTTLAPQETGISALNRYDDPAMWGRYYREFSIGPIGTGLAIGDCDGDGRPDVFVVTKTGENRLFRNLGGFKFDDVTARAGVAGPTGAWKQGAAFADIDNDGDLDLYVCRFNAPNLLYVNRGDGTFAEEAAARGLALSDASGLGAFCDYDRDGWLDVFVQTNLLDGERRPNGQRDRLYRNKGDGVFVDVTDRAGITGETQGHSATWWDYDEDGWPDLYVANDFKDPDQLYRNNRDGTFTQALSWVVPHTPHSSMGADVGDVNNDGHIDLLVADMAATTRYKDHRGMAKLREGLTDNEQRPEAAPQYMRNALYLNSGAGVMLEAALLTGLDATDWTWAVRLEDFDNDGRVDAFFTNGMVRELHGLELLKLMMA
ncbi:MAG TPA: VCBS repeat-containing protein [Opitutus sp.]|nr:VCBS repeat-containing protein [Opitutus sp.]